MKKEIILFVLIGLCSLFSCQRNSTIHKFVRSFRSCPDTLLTYLSGEEWEGLRQFKEGTYHWGKDNLETKGIFVYKDKNRKIGKGSIINLEGRLWVIYNLKYKYPPKRKGNPVPMPEDFDVKLYLKKICKNY